MNQKYVDRFMSRIEVAPDGCWIWQSTINNQGYGVIAFEGKARKAHRFAHEVFIGPIPEGFDVDHLCRVRSCANPEHLEAVTHRENVLRGVGRAAQGARQETCVKGHPFDSTTVRPNGRGQRVCRTCNNERNRAYYHRQKLARLTSGGDATAAVSTSGQVAA